MFTMSTSEKAKPAGGYHHGNLREALVAEGLTLLDESGSADLSLRELARQVGVSANAVYRHFENKEALLVAMAAEGFRRLAAVQLQAVLQREHPAEGFLESGRAYVNFARQHPALFRLMFGRFSAANRSEEMESAGQLAYEGLRHGVAATLHLQPDSPQVVTAAMHAWSIVHGLSHLILDGQFDAITDDIDGMIDTVLRQTADFARPLLKPEKG
jgi:AcrR family transcriptional regulator